MMEGLIMEEKSTTDSGSPVINSEDSSPPVSGDYSSGGAEDVAAVDPPAAAPGVNMSIGVVPGGGGVAGGTEMGSGVGVGLSEIDSSGKKKRGRPRKYDENGNLTPSYMKSASQHATGPPPPGFHSTPPANVSGNRGRGRPAGSGSFQLLASMGEMYLNTAGADFIPHVMQVNPGEDVAEKIFALVLNGSRGVCVISANGTISNVTIRQPCSAGGTLTYEGRFEILALTGSYTLEEKNGIRARSGSLSVSLAGPDGRVIGGGIAGMLRAAGPIQMVVGSFNVSHGGKEQKKRKPYGPRSASPRPLPLPHSTPAFPALPISQAPPNGSLFPSPSPQPHMSTHAEAAANNSSYNPITSSNASARGYWNGVEHTGQQQQRPSPDINVSAPMEE